MKKRTVLLMLCGAALLPLVAMVLLGSNLKVEEGCERAMAQLKAMHLPADTLLRFRLDMDDPASKLRPKPSSELSVRGEGRGEVWAWKGDGDLHVFVETEDNGHRGGTGWAATVNCQEPVWKTDEWGEIWAFSTGKRGCWQKIHKPLRD